MLIKKLFKLINSILTVTTHASVLKIRWKVRQTFVEVYVGLLKRHQGQLTIVKRHQGQLTIVKNNNENNNSNYKKGLKLIHRLGKYCDNFVILNHA